MEVSLFKNSKLNIQLSYPNKCHLVRLTRLSKRTMKHRCRKPIRHQQYRDKKKKKKNLRHLCDACSDSDKGRSGVLKCKEYIGGPGCNCYVWLRYSYLLCSNKLYTHHIGSWVQIWSVLWHFFFSRQMSLFIHTV